MAGCDARWDGEGYLSLVGDESVDSPGVRRGVEAVLVDLEPLKSGHCRLRRARNLGTTTVMPR